ncbi:peptidase inhibitor family I36 protein [Streptomyces cinereoruber]|uniref:peptidase inhibitor family I36 protein n=1 Tax=Streptomyces cinereoruber TaxID=67260 RepID=UPI003C2D48C1
MAGKVHVFTGKDYNGASADLEVGTYNLGDGTGSVGNDSITSVKVEPGYQVTLYKDRDCQGNSQTFLYNVPLLPNGLNDTVSSVKVEPLPEPPADSEEVIFIQPPAIMG